MRPILLLSIAGIIAGVYGLANAQHLPNLPTKPQPQFESPSFCPPQGAPSKRADPELNRKKNRVDGSTKYYRVALNDIETLSYPIAIVKRKRTDWTAEQTISVAKYEGIPIVIEGYLALTP